MALLAQGLLTRPTIRRREPGPALAWPADLPPLLGRIYAARGIERPEQVIHRLARLTRPDGLGGLDAATGLLVEAIRADQSIIIAGDYDCDGATGCAVGVRGLRMLGARHVDFVVPDRQRHGYGLSPGLLAELAHTPDVIVTVDNGINAHAGITAARERGIRVIVTDHHLPGEALPPADAIVNPNVPGDRFPSKALAGVGVMFYLLLALRARLGRQADLASLLDLVALGTVADMVPLDDNNRILVAAGLRRIRQGRCCPGVAALTKVAGRDTQRLVASDFGFGLAPRLNAAGRLENMGVGIECLLSDDQGTALALAQELDAINRERRERQAGMMAGATRLVAGLAGEAGDAVVVSRPDWHPGVVGLVASKLKERLHRPVVALAPSEPGSPQLRGSARSIRGVHIRDALVDVAARAPDLMASFGGHAMAAGMTLDAADLPRFKALFQDVIMARLDDDLRQAVIWSDGELAPREISLDNARALRFGGPWGQAFPPPLFDNRLVCVEQRSIGADGTHRKLQLQDPRNGAVHEAVMFSVEDDLPMEKPLQVVFELAVNQWRGRQSLQLLLRHVVPVQ